MNKHVSTLVLCFLISCLPYMGVKAQDPGFAGIVAGLVNSIDYSFGMKGKVYTPTKINPELNVESARKNILWFLKNLNSDEHVEMYYNDSTRVKDNWIKNRTVIVTDDYIEFDTRNEGIVRINFYDIMFDNIVHSTLQNSESSCELIVGKYHFGSCASPKFPDAIFFMRERFEQKLLEEQMKEFEKSADAYHSFSENHTITEEQRKYFVQGNAMVEAKNGPQAIKLYNKAFAIDPVSYPEGYYNQALIAGAIEKYRYAIFCMQKYLMLVPDAENLQDAKDQIYKWEALLNL